MTTKKIDLIDKDKWAGNPKSHKFAGDPLTVIDRIEAYIKRYLALSDEIYSLPIALWIAATYTWETFDAFPYLCITSLTKQSGKSLLASLIEYSCNRPQNLAGLTGAGMFHCIEERKPVLLFDEAEMLNSESASMMRSVLNVGYRRGVKIPRVGKDGLIDYDTYCPKVFILIGDVYDTLRDRSIIIRMKRGKAAERFIQSKAKIEGEEIRQEMKEIIGEDKKTPFLKNVEDEYKAFHGLPFLPPRDEEIWTPLFIMCSLLCPSRTSELTRCAADMAVEKTMEVVSFRTSKSMEEHAESEQYALILLRNILQIAPSLQIEARTETKPRKTKQGSAQKQPKTVLNPDAVLTALKKMDAAPWRKYKHDGLTRDQMAELLSRHFGVKTIAWRVESKPVRVYDLAAIQQKANEVGITEKGEE